MTVVTQDAVRGTVLMVAHADREALERTLATGEMHYRSRRRGPWHEGATSGNVQRVVALRADCDRDAVLALVEPAGPACHTGSASCFRAERGPEGAVQVLAELDAWIAARGAPPAGQATPLRATTHHPSTAPGTTSPPSSYTRRLLDDRYLRLKKFGEEAAGLAVACADEDHGRAVEEAADLVHHALVALRALGLGLDDVARVLAARAR